MIIFNFESQSVEPIIGPEISNFDVIQDDINLSMVVGNIGNFTITVKNNLASSVSFFINDTTLLG